MKPKNKYSLIDEVTPDLEGFLDAEQDPDCEESTYSLQGTEVTRNGSTE